MKKPVSQFAYIHKYVPKPDSGVTGIRRVYDACREGVKTRKNVEFVNSWQPPTKTFARTFLEEANWADKVLSKDAAVLVMDVIPLYDSDFNDARFWWQPKFDTFKHFDRVIVPSEWVKKTLVQDLGVKPERVDVALLGYNRDAFKLMTVDRLAWCDANGVPADRFLVGHVSYGYTRKNLERVMKALMQFPDALLVKVGRDTLTDFLARQYGMEKQVVFLPAMTDAELAEFYNVIDLFAFPSTSEGFGLPALEAQACGCPTLTSSTTALGEIIGPSAKAVDPFSIPEILEVMLRPPARETPSPEWLSRFDWRTIGAAVNNWLA